MDIFDSFFSHLSPQPLSYEIRKAFIYHMQIEELKAGKFLVRGHQQPKNIFYLHDGFASVWYMADKKITRTFFNPNDFIACINCPL